MEVLKFPFIFCVIFCWNTASAGYVKLVHTNAPCKNNSDCTKYPDSYCKKANAVCSCRKGYEFDLWDDVCIPKEIDLVCEKDYDCYSKVEHSYCNNGSICRCKPGYVASKNKAECLSVSKLHSSCQEDVQCKGKHSSCNPQSQQCVCDSDYHESKGSHECIPDYVKKCHLQIAFDPKVAGSKPVSIDEIPYMLQIEYYGKYVCGASLLKPNYAISAAHCFEDVYEESYVTVRAGTSYLDELGEVVGVSKIIKHESYDKESFDYDIAVLRLVKNLEIGPKMQTIDINNGDPPVEGTKARVSGWGKTETDSASFCLKSAEILVQNSTTCSVKYASAGKTITERMFCAADEGKDTCRGDSGGPLVIDGKLAGITSFGKGCGNKFWPGVYVNVAALADWITRTLSENPDTFSSGTHDTEVNDEKFYEINEKDIIAMNETIKTLEMDDFDLQARVMGNNNVDIIGIPEMPNENLYDIVPTIATLLGLRNITSEDISSASRVTGKTTTMRLITAQFISSKKWEDFLKAAREMHFIFSRDVIPEISTEENMRITVFESMSPKHKKLFDACSKKAKQYGLKCVAYTVGKFYLKKNKEDKDAIIISYPHQLDKINYATVRAPHGELWGKVPDLPTLHWFDYNDFYLHSFINN